MSISYLHHFTGFNFIFPLNAGNNEAIPAEATAQAMDGINKYLIRMGVETFLPIQSIVVVTSPMVVTSSTSNIVAITINAAYQILSFLSETTFCKIDISTIVAVKLSIIADKIKANPLKTRRDSLLGFWKFIIL